MHFNSCHMWYPFIFLTILVTYLYCCNNKAHPTPTVKCPSVTENREETSFWQTHNTECTGLWQFWGGTRINAENKLRNYKRKQNKQKETGGSQQRITPWLTTPWSTLKPPPHSEPSLCFVFLNVTAGPGRNSRGQITGLMSGSIEAEEKRVR